MGGLTRANVEHVVERVFGLHEVHHEVGEAHAVLGDAGLGGYRLHGLAHQEEALRILQAALRQVLVGAHLGQCAALPREDGSHGPSHPGCVAVSHRVPGDYGDPDSPMPPTPTSPLHPLPERDASSLGTKEIEAGKMGEEEGEMQRGLDDLKTDCLSVL